MVPETPPANDWADAVTAANQHVAARSEAADQVSARNRSKAHAPRIALAVVVLVAALVWDAWLWTRPGAGTALQSEGIQLAWLVADAVETVEDHRAADGALPRPGEVADLLTDQVVYEPRDEGFSVTVRGAVTSLTWDGALPLDEWLRTHAAPTLSPVASR